MATSSPQTCASQACAARHLSWPSLLRLLAMILGLHFTQCYALGLGEARLMSGLGQDFKAQVAILGGDADDLLHVCVKAKLFSLDGSLLSMAQIHIQNTAQARVIQVTSAVAMYEPVLNLQIKLDCGQQIERSWQLLLDLPGDAPVLAVAPSANPSKRQAELHSSSTKSSQSELPSAAIRRHPAMLKKDSKQASSQGATPSSTGIVLAEKTSAAPASAMQINTTSNASPASSGRMATKIAQAPATARNVLQLSRAGDAEADAELEHIALRLSLGLSSESLEKLAAARVHVPAVPENLQVAREFSLMQQKINMLEAEANRLQRLSAQQDALLNANPSQRNTQSWLIGLSLLLLAAVAAIAWLYSRMQQLKSVGEQALWQVTLANTLQMQAQENFAPAAKEAQESPAAAPPAPAAQKVHTQAEPIHQIDFEDGPAESESILPTVDELTDTMHEADFWISLGQVEKAIHVLESFTASAPGRAPLTWLRLFDLYRKLQQRDRYEALMLEFQRHFNAQIPPWEHSTEFDAKQNLESMPSLMEKICVLWGSTEIVSFLEGLIIDQREGARLGFALPSYLDILFLLDLARALQDQPQSQTSAHEKRMAQPLRFV